MVDLTGPPALSDEIAFTFEDNIKKKKNKQKQKTKT